MSTVMHVLDATIGDVVVPLALAHRKKDQAPYWVFDGFGQVPAHQAARFGVPVAPLDKAIPATVDVFGVTVTLTVEKETSFTDPKTKEKKTTTYADRRVGSGAVEVPGVGERPINVTISQKVVGGSWNVRITVPNGGGTGGRAPIDIRALAGTR